MGKTTNILDLNNRLEKVEKKNVAQNNYNSLKNRPKINGNLLTGDKTGSQLGLVEAQDITDINTAIGNMSDLSTTATDLVGAINEVNGKTDITTITGTGYYGCTYYAHKSNHVVTLKVTNIINDTIGQDMNLCTLPEGYKPKLFEQYVYGSYNNNSFSESNAVVFKVRVNGDVVTYNNKEFNNGVLTCTYIAD